MRKSRICTSLLAAALLTAGAFGAASSSDKIEIERILTAHVKAMGDVRGWESVQLVHQRGHFEIKQPGVKFDEWRRRPGLMRIQWVNERRQSLLDSGCNAEVAWYVAPQQTPPVFQTIPVSQAQSLQRKAQIENPIIQEAHSVFRNWELLEEREVEGAACYVLSHAPWPNYKEIVYLDKKTYFLLRLEMISEQGVEIEQYSDYKKEGDVYFPYKITYLNAEGEKQEVMVIDKLRVNPGIGSIFFRPPAMEQEQPAK